jgi:hypothetical protein
MDDAHVTEQCAKCSAPLADDQRYCLQCGEPRPHVRRPQSDAPAAQTPPAPPVVPAIPSVPPSGRNNTLALLAGVGVLLLAMGVGVLIGRAGAGSAKVPPAQVISVGGAATDASTTATTPTATTEAPASSTKKAAKSKAKASSSGSGSSSAKPAPASVLKSVQTHQSGSSYEQKSKNLPDVVETG